MQALHRGHLRLARRAPGRPEVQRAHASAQRRERDRRAAVEPRQREVGRGLARSDRDPRRAAKRAAAPKTATAITERAIPSARRRDNAESAGSRLLAPCRGLLRRGLRRPSCALASAPSPFAAPSGLLAGRLRPRARASPRSTQLDERHRRRVADARAQLDDARVAARPLAKRSASSSKSLRATSLARITRSACRRACRCRACRA